MHVGSKLLRKKNDNDFRLQAGPDRRTDPCELLLGTLGFAQPQLENVMVHSNAVALVHFRPCVDIGTIQTSIATALSLSPDVCVVNFESISTFGFESKHKRRR